MRDFAKGLPRKIVESLIVRLAVGGIIALALLLYVLSRTSSDVVVSVPVAVLIGAGLVAGVFFAYRARRERKLNDLQDLFDKIIYESLEAFQKNVTHPGEFDPVAVIEKGVLHPVRDVMRKIYGCEYRFSVLERDGSGAWRMPAQAGHRLESQQKFRLEYEKSFSRFSFESKQIEWANDVDEDRRFTKHPQAEGARGYAAIMSVPILVGGESVAVFNAVATRKNVFRNDRDRTRISLLGSIVNIAWAMTKSGEPPP
jgi:hypothetical protein